MKVKDYTRVVELCNKALQINPNHSKCWYRRAEARRAREEWDESQRDYTRLLELSAEREAERYTATSSTTNTSSSSSSAASSVSSTATPPTRDDGGSSVPLDEFTLNACRTALRDISTRRASQAVQQRKKLSGFMKQATLYDDKPAVGVDNGAAPVGSVESAASSPSSSSGDDYSWLNSAANPQSSPFQSLMDVVRSVIHTMRGWCGASRGGSGTATKKST